MEFRNVTIMFFLIANIPLMFINIIDSINIVDYISRLDTCLFDILVLVLFMAGLPARFDPLGSKNRWAWTAFF